MYSRSYSITPRLYYIHTSIMPRLRIIFSPSMMLLNYSNNYCWQLLVGRGHQCFEAKDGAEALDKVG